MLATHPNDTATMHYGDLTNDPRFMRVLQLLGESVYHELWVDVDDVDGDSVYIVVPESGEHMALVAWAQAAHEVKVWRGRRSTPLTMLGQVQYVLDVVEHDTRESWRDDRELTSYSLDEPHHPC